MCLIGEKEKALIIITGNAIKSSIKQSGNHTEWSPSTTIYVYGAINTVVYFYSFFDTFKIEQYVQIENYDILL